VFILWKDVAHWLATHACLVSRLRITGAILHQPPYPFMACTRTTAPLMTTTTSTTKIKTETTTTTYPDAQNVAAACIFPFPLHSNHLHEVTVFWVATSLCTSRVSSQASHRHGNPTSGTVMNVVLSAAAMLIAGTFIRRLSNTISCTCSVISGVVALFGLPSRGSS